ncbi:MAG: glycosyltransferase family 4 protein [Deltaproteobacteria bacterium]|nr:glycosyltransferase family 4 protein [Deltaproteobacteria bacterium]
MNYKKKSILFFTQEEKVPSARFRVLQLIPYLEKVGYKCIVNHAKPNMYQTQIFPGYTILKGFNSITYCAKSIINLLFRLSGLIKLLRFLSRLLAIFKLKKADIIFIQRPLLSYKSSFLERLFKRLNPNIIFDFDDAIYYSPNPKERKKREDALSKILSLSKSIIVGNNFLASRCNGFKNIYVIPTGIDTKRFSPKNKKKKENIIIGWTGTSSNFKHLLIVQDLLKELLKKRSDLIFQVIADKDFYFNDSTIPVNNIRWDEKVEVEKLKNFDIGIMPLYEDEWTKGKCGFKIIQYMAVSIPVVGSPVGVNKEIIEHGVNGFLAKKDEEWIKYLSYLIDNPEKRKVMGNMGRKKVEKEFSIKALIPQYINLFQFILENNQEKN